MLTWCNHLSNLMSEFLEDQYCTAVDQNIWLNHAQKRNWVSKSFNHVFCNSAKCSDTNLVPRSLVDEAEGKIWQSKIICFSWLAAPFDSCPIPFLKIDAVFRGKLSSNSSSNLEISAVGENEKPIRKDKRRKDLEVICHSGLNNFCNTIVVPLPKSQTRHPARAQAPPHLSHKTLQTPCPVRFFFALTRSPNLRKNTACQELIPEAFLGDLAITIGRRGMILQKLFTSKNLCGRWRGAWARALDDV